jgi:5-formyltetrahydrofolate cyclo-ligase
LARASSRSPQNRRLSRLTSGESKIRRGRCLRLRGLRADAGLARGTERDMARGEDKRSRWVGSASARDVLRAELWQALIDRGVNVGPTFEHIPNFVGADVAAKRLSDLGAWKAARVVKCNPDPPQAPLRLRALYEGKVLIAPLPYFNSRILYVQLDPDKLAARNIDFETAATAQGLMRHGRSIALDEMPRLDFCVVGCVAATRRGGCAGKGGFADLEQCILREFGKVDATTPVATSVHSSQIVAVDRVTMEEHDCPLNFIATELELIDTQTPYPRPLGVAWDRIRPDQFLDVAFLKNFRAASQGRRDAK